jgi:hypothetical protein
MQLIALHLNELGDTLYHCTALVSAPSNLVLGQLRATRHWLHRPSSGSSKPCSLLILFLSCFSAPVGLEGLSGWGYQVIFLFVT